MMRKCKVSLKESSAENLVAVLKETKHKKLYKNKQNILVVSLDTYQANTSTYYSTSCAFELNLS